MYVNSGYKKLYKIQNTDVLLPFLLGTFRLGTMYSRERQHYVPNLLLDSYCYLLLHRHKVIRVTSVERELEKIAKSGLALVSSKIGDSQKTPNV